MIDDESKLNTFHKSDVPFIDHHDTLILQYDFSIGPIQSSGCTFCSFKQCDTDAFRSDISLVVNTYMSLFQSCPPNTLLNNFNTDLLTLLDKYASVCVLTPRPNHNPWLTDHLKYLIAKRNRFYKIFKKSNANKHKENYKILSKQVCILNKTTQRDYCSAKFEAAPDGASVFRVLTQMGYNNKRPVKKTALDFFFCPTYTAI